ncbi:MAG: GNAT family N-acetyltransferase [Nevskiaceae bacterium]|nr:MAG: GNAT family N-acetyltransferase [Nevskiaceae bacterium]TAM21395.1 MAG: GNAT family N-acetyltransferase [Nevskiaceae bacterium]
MRIRHLARIAEVPAAAWDALFPAAYPFIRHDWLRALEEHGCAAPDSGWTPCHLLLEDDAGNLLAAAPLYLKAHSWGEFVFDFAWAEGAQQAGIRYYPKLLSAVPFTPSTGPRLGARDEASRAQLIAALLQLPEHSGTSSWHGLFLSATEAEACAEQGALRRHDLQFHWHNRPGGGYADFEDFLAALSHDKRKKIRQERRKLAGSGLGFDTLPGEAFGEAQWAELYALYANTYEERGQPPYLSLEFFLDYARRPGSPVRVTVARDGVRTVAMALLLQDGNRLYGRHWGAAERYDGLHFETCYYQGVQHCIREGLAVYDAGAQGEHKLARGFDPVMTHSVHSISDPRLAQAVAHALSRERLLVAARLEQLQAHRAYRQVEPTP